MISFYPGPSQVYEEIPKYVKDAYKEGILSINHRSEAFLKLCADTQKIMRSNLNIPADYMIFFTSSATECWEIIAQSLPHLTSYHFYNGSFGEKWFSYTRKLKRNVIGYQYRYQQALDLTGFDVSVDKGIICITPNETSNGSRIDNNIITKLKQNYPGHLLAADVTSSLGGVDLPIASADIWFASVQKCLGLPAGMGTMICSPLAMKAVLAENENNHYNSLTFMREMMKDYQTTYTPNILSIYLLKRTQEKAKNVKEINKLLLKRKEKYYKLLTKSKLLSPLITDQNVQSDTVIACKGEPETIKNTKIAALQQEELLLGNGYGFWKDDTFRIANFPALKSKEVKKLRSFLKTI